MNPGAAFEDLIRKSFEEEGIYIRRIKTRMTQFKGDNEIADFYVFDNQSLIYIEAKTTLDNRFSFGMLQTNQVIGLHVVSKYDGIYGGVMVEMREFGRYFYVPIELIDYQLSKGKLSLNMEELNLYARELPKHLNSSTISVKNFGKGVKGITYSVPKKEEEK